MKTNMDALVLVLSLIFVQILQTTSYKFNPETRHIEVNDGGDYWIEFNDLSDPEFYYCYYESDVISGSYPISHSERNNLKLLESQKSQGIETLAASSTNILKPESVVCGFHFTDITDESPKKWTITATDKSGKNHTEIVRISFFYNITPLLGSLRVNQLTSFFNYLKTKDAILTNCFVRFDNITVELDMNQKRTNISSDMELKSRLDSLGEGKCGFILSNAVRGDPTKFTFIATDNHDKSYKAQFEVVILEKGVSPEDTYNRSSEVFLGDSATILCGTLRGTASTSYQKYCYLYNPLGKLVSSDQICDYKLEIVTLNDLGVWTCTIGYEFTMKSLTFEMRLIAKSTENVESWTEDKESYHIIGCELKSISFGSLSFCKFVRPDGELILVQTGRAMGRYTTVSTDLERQICSLEIAKPLTNEDKGTWRCEANGGYGTTTGAYITIEKSTGLPYSKLTQLSVHLNDVFSIKCSVPYSSPFCYVISPNGTFYRPQAPNIYSANLGDCIVNFNQALSEHNGTWSCFFGRGNGLPDEEIKVELSIIELKVLYADASVSIGEDAELICNTGGLPLEYCRFVSPSGLSYYLRQGDTKTNKISYSGRGLDYGDCGIKISRTQIQENGQWTCYISVGRRSNVKKVDVNVRMWLKVSDSGLATSIAGGVGIALGVIVTVIAGGLFAIYRWRGRHHNPVNTQLDEDTRRTSHESSDSNDRIMLQGSQRAFYTTSNADSIL